MDFIDEIRELAERALDLKDMLETEEATKNALIMPFIRLLGYDVFDPREVMPEYTADLGGIKKGEKVDYAIFKDGSPAILFECKAAGVALDNSHKNQLFRYFSAIQEVRFGVLTNGIAYRFFSDIEAENRMDDEPFLELNLLDIRESLVEQLKKFTKDNFDAATIVSTAKELKYTRKIKRILTAEYESPSIEFVTFFNDKGVYFSQLDKKVREQYVKDAFQQFVRDLVDKDPQPANSDKEAQGSATDPEQSDSTQTDDKGWQPLSELNPHEFDSKPTEILFPDNSTVSITAWIHIMVEAVRWLINNNKLTESNCPIPRSGGSKQNLVATSPKHSTGTNFHNSENIGPFYIEKNYTPEYIARNVKHIIQYVGQDPAQFKVR